MTSLDTSALASPEPSRPPPTTEGPPPPPPPSQLRASLHRRLERLDAIELAGQDAIDAELELCRRSARHWFHWWAWTYDPRLANVPGASPYMPFDLYDRQLELLEFLEERLARREEGLVEKSRDMGFTYETGGLALHRWRFMPGFKTTFGSRDADEVDKIGSSDSILEKIRIMMRAQPRWMLPKGFRSSKHDNHMLLVNPDNENTIRGEAGDEMGRGGRSTLYVLDEAGYMRRADRVDAATSATSDVRIWGSSAPLAGIGTLFARKRFGGGLRPHQIFRLHYSADPRMTPERVAELRRNVEPHVWEAEREINYSAAVEGIAIPAPWVESAKKIAGLMAARGTPLQPDPDGIGGLDVGGGKARSVYVSRFGPIVRVPVSWGEPDTTETAIRALDAAQADKPVRTDNGAPCIVKTLRFDSVAIGQGVLSTLTRHGRFGLTTVATNVGVEPSERVWADGGTSEEKFFNLKAEAWWLMRERFKATHQMVLFLEGLPREKGGIEHPASDLISIPDDTQGFDAVQLAAQLSQPKRMHNEKGKIVIETKPRMAARGLASPDHADALALTFCGHSAAEQWIKAFGT
jgi:phage terminase large subunit